MKVSKTLLAGLLISASLPVAAEPVPGFRLNTGVYVDEGDAMVGLSYEIPVSGNLSIVPGAEYVFVDRGDMWTFNVDSRFDLNVNTRDPMWAGIGMGAIRREIGRFEDTDYGVNLLWGMDFDRNQNWVPYVSTKAILSDNSHFAVTFGLRFGNRQGGRSASAD